MSRSGTKVVVDEAGIRRLLEAGRWPCDRIAPDTWRSHFRGKRASFPIFVRIDHERGLLVFAIVPLLKSPVEKGAAEKLYRRLLELNHVALMAKFSLDDDLDVVLSVEYPTHELDASEFTDALDVLGYYADRHYDELKALAAGG
jgi:hypothetical protein